MAAKKKAGSGKRMARRVEPAWVERPAADSEEPRQADKPRIAPRIQEKESGLGVLKAVGIGLIVLIIGAGMLSRMMGGETDTRGDKLPGERCDATVECRRGSICYSYQGEAQRCFRTCSAEDSCDPGYRCVSEAARTGRRKTRVRSVCVADDVGE